MKSDWSDLEEFRKSPHGYESNVGDKFGWFIWNKGRTQIRVMAVNGVETGWEHVSVTVAYSDGGKMWTPRMPKWDEMCWVKRKFWSPSECVLQYHPAEEDYVNVSANCLHLWRPVHGEIPMPPKICV